MIRPGDVVTANFPGATVTKRRPGVVVSTELYQRTRPDVILALLTTQTGAAKCPSDYLLQDWPAAGLHSPSAFRSFLFTLPSRDLTPVGHVTERDWRGIQNCLKAAIAIV
jgi:mRNA interferase MazF